METPGCPEECSVLARSDCGRGRQIFLQNRDIQRVGDLTFFVVAVDDTDELITDSHFNARGWLSWRIKRDPLVGKCSAKILLYPNDLVSRHPFAPDNIP
mgnify:CR=1 FL=1